MTATIDSSGKLARRRIARLCAALGAPTMLALLPHAAQAQSGPGLPPYDTMTDLGTLGGDYSYPYDVSDTGAVIVGEAHDPSNSSQRAFRWTPENGMENLGTLGGSWSYARAVSGDGSTIIGYSDTGSSSARAFRWTEAGGMQDLGTLGGNYSYAYAVNTDGNVVVGYSYISGNSYHHAFRWTNGGGMQDLGTLGGGWSYATDVSGNGDVVVGESHLSGGDYHAFRWTTSGGIQDLGTLGGNYSYARAVSRDGSTVAGYSYLTGNPNHHAFRWTADGGMQDLGTLGGNWSYAEDTSNDGSVVIGYAETASSGYSHAFRWTGAGGMQDLGTLGGNYSYAREVSGDGKVVAGYAYLPGDNYHHAFRWTEDDGMIDLGTLGGNWSYVTGLSNDGGTIVGYAQNAAGYSRAFIYRTQRIDFTNMIASFPLAASDLEASGEIQRGNLSTVLDAGCQVVMSGRACLGGSVYAMRAGADQTAPLMRRHDQGFRVNFGYRLSPAVVLGAGVGLFDAQDRSYSIDPATAFHYGAWLDVDPDGPGLLGPRARIAVGGAVQRNLIERGQGLENVQVTPGHADLTTLTVQGELRYGIPIGKLALIPTVGFTWQRTTLDGFVEADGDWPASFGRTRWKTSYVTAGADIALPLGTDTRVTLGAKADFDTRSDPVVVAGTSEIPGMESFSAPSLYQRKDTRGRFELGVEHVSAGIGVSANVGLHTPVIGSKPVLVFGIGFGMGL